MRTELHFLILMWKDRDETKAESCSTVTCGSRLSRKSPIMTGFIPLRCDLRVSTRKIPMPERSYGDRIETADSSRLPEVVVTQRRLEALKAALLSWRGEVGPTMRMGADFSSNLEAISSMIEWMANVSVKVMIARPKFLMGSRTLCQRLHLRPSSNTVFVIEANRYTSS